MNTGFVFVLIFFFKKWENSGKENEDSMQANGVAASQKAGKEVPRMSRLPPRG